MDSVFRLDMSGNGWRVIIGCDANVKRTMPFFRTFPEKIALW
ncbi:hypothetical protein GXY_02366 [Novacetimonas hansenii ATCC 23769]|uniref:Uncharacterized protein n=1 Tax=Novacetimonas hansenii ATCC 23769 TaxID=714995 RepID=D5QBH9_NOVHA|nr:hypothetical protein GXY_02366 [Novacetimonas hansenii ATCC 23769]